MIQMPVRTRKKFLQAVGRRSGPAAWDVHRHDPRDGTLLLDPVVFVERLLPDAFTVINEIMRCSDTASLPDVDPVALTPPPPHPRYDADFYSRVVTIGGGQPVGVVRRSAARAEH